MDIWDNEVFETSHKYGIVCIYHRGIAPINRRHIQDIFIDGWDIL